jgi:hypothetical protein
MGFRPKIYLGTSLQTEDERLCSPRFRTSSHLSAGVEDKLRQLYVDVGDRDGTKTGH